MVGLVGDYPANWNAVQDVQKKAQLLAMQDEVEKRAAQYTLNGKEDGNKASTVPKSRGIFLFWYLRAW